MFERRLRILAMLGGLYLLAIVFRLFDMQVLESERWRLQAAELGQRTIRLTARRGTILDRNGVPLAEDRIQMNLNLRLDRRDDGSWICAGCGKPLHTEYEQPPRRCRTCGGVAFAPGEQPDWSRLPGLLGITNEEFAERGREAGRRYDRAVKTEMDRRKKNWGSARLRDVKNVLLPREWLFFEDAGSAAVKEVVLHPDRYWGVVVRPVRRRRRVEHPSIRRTIGKLGPVTEADARKMREDDGLSFSSIWRMRVGRSGLERKLEDRLSCREGRKVVERNRRGEVRTVLSERPARDGTDVRITLDLRLQKKMYEALARTCALHQSDGGAFVAIDPANGEVLAMVGFASENELWDPAISSIVPGSVFKVVTAIAALETGLIDPGETLFCDSGRWNGIGCAGHAHGETGLVSGIYDSCNKYFAWTATKIGVELWSDWGKRLGFGKPTGIEITREMGGLVPDRDWKVRAYRKNPEYWDTDAFTASDLRQAGFGRGPVLVTPVQVARFMAIIANGGRFVTPSLVMGEGKVGEVVMRTSLPLVREGLKATVTRGTARGKGLDRYRVAGKTGTAEVKPGKKIHHSWFAGYAPAENPRVAFACLIKNTPSYGADAATPVILAFLDEVFRK